MPEIVGVLIEYIRNETGFQGEISSDEDLLAAGVLDSFNIVSLAVYAQERFGVEFDGDDMVRDNLARLSALATLIERRRAEQT
jgi:acyl carrier protein